MKSILAMLLIVGSVGTARAQEQSATPETPQSGFNELFGTTTDAVDENSTENSDDQNFDRRPRRRRLPYGSYLRSCYACAADNQVLVCICPNRRGRSFRTAIYYRQCHGDIVNRNGRLSCW
jgi:hypothetical protein